MADNDSADMDKDAHLDADSQAVAVYTPADDDADTPTQQFAKAHNGEVTPDAEKPDAAATPPVEEKKDGEIKPEFKGAAAEEAKPDKPTEPETRPATDREIHDGTYKTTKPDGTTIDVIFGTGQLSFGEAFSKLIQALALYLRDPEMFPFMIDLLYPEDDYIDPVERGRHIENIKEVARNPEHPDRQLTTAAFVSKHFPHVTEVKGTLLGPDLLKELERKGPTKFKHHVNLTIEAVEEYNDNLADGQVPLDTNLVLNQIYQESSFHENAIGKQTQYGQAQGMAQLLPKTGKEYGLHNREDFFDPKKALPAAVQHIGDLTQKYKSQTLAMIAYNGGNGAVKWIADKLDKPVQELTTDEWMDYTGKLNEKLGLSKDTEDLWRHHTRDYIVRSHSDYWSEEQKQLALATMDKLGLTKPKQEENVAEKPDTEPKPEEKPAEPVLTTTTPPSVKPT